MEENNRPLVSVIMPAYNAARFVEAAVRSVLAQTVTDWELLVLDDGSSDETVSIVAALAEQDGRIRLLPNEANMGVARTRNRGFDLCRGAYVALLDSDDVWHPEKLEKQLALARQTGAQLIYSSYAIVDSRGNMAKPTYVVPETVDFPALLKENVIGCSTVLLDGTLLETYRFQTDFYHEDYVLWLQMLRDGHLAAGCTEPLVDWRFLENSRSFDKRKSARNRWRIYRDYLHLSLVRSVCCFAAYAYHGFRKYRRSR